MDGMESYEPYSAAETRRLHRSLERAALFFVCLASLECAISGIVDASASTSKRWRSAIYAVQLASGAILASSTTLAAKSIVGLWATSLLDFCFKLNSFDFDGALTSVFLSASVVLSLIDVLSSRKSSRAFGSLDSKQTLLNTDFAAGTLREFASRYKLAAIGSILSTISILHTLFTSESLLGDRFRRELARQAWSRCMAVCAFACAVGSNDFESKLVPPRFQKKSI